MYSQNDLDEAVAAGALTADAANALRNFVDRQRATPAADEEQFRLLTGFNDIFVSIAAAILLFAVGWIGQSIGQLIGLRSSRTARRRWPAPRSPRPLGAWLCSSPPSAAWRCRRSCCCWHSSAVCCSLRRIRDRDGGRPRTVRGQARNGRHRSAPSRRAIAAGAAWLHWKRFRVPITVAAGAAAVAAIALGAARCGARRSRQHRRRSSSASCCCSASACSCSRCGGIRRIRRGSPAARTSPSGSTCWPRR